MSLDPMKLRSDTVVLLGMAETSRDDAPWDNPDVEIWGINESYAERNKSRDKKGPFVRRWDRWFQLHPRWDFLRPGNFNHENHPLWITNQEGPCMFCRGRGKLAVTKGECPECGGSGAYVPREHRREDFGYPFPVYTLTEEPMVPGSAKYPLDAVVAEFGKHSRYFTNSFGYMAALAILLGAKRIEAYGFEMSSKTEYGEQKPNANFWAGIAIGRGIDFHLPDGCSLLGGREQLYGYDKVPGFTKMHAEIHASALEQAFAKSQAEMNKLRGAKEAMFAKMRAMKGQTKANQDLMQREFNEMVEAELEKSAELNSLFGALQQAKRVHAEVSMLSSVSELGFVKYDGKKQKVDLTEFERMARTTLEQRMIEPEPDEGMVPAGEDLYGA